VLSVAAGLYDWLLFGHIVAAMGWVGGGVMLGVVVGAVVRRRDPDAVARVVVGLSWVGPRVLAPSTVAVLGLGVWMVLDSSGWGFDQLWVELALGLFLAAGLIGAVHQSRAALRAERALEAGDADEALRQLTRWSWGYRLIVLVLLAAVWDMVFKPGL
jgi:uncharacterized membrane protein